MNKILYHPKTGTSNFFLGDFPQEPVKSFEAVHYISAEQEYMGAVEEYKEELQRAKEEAIKNGEIVNTNLLPIQWVSTDSTSYFYKGSMLRPGDIFDIPEGVGVENRWMALASTSQNSKCVECTESRLQEIKDDYAAECFMNSWSELLIDATFSEVDVHHAEVCKRYAFECSKASLEEAKQKVLFEHEWANDETNHVVKCIIDESNITLL